MKNHFRYSVLLSILYCSYAFSQIGLSNPVNPYEIYGSSVFLDASTNFSSEAGMPNNQGKGMVIPSVDLVNFEFNLTLADGITFPTYFDGMMVYNRATGTTLNTGDRPSTATAVTPGFYYFSNPDGATNGNITDGVWTPMGGKATLGSISSSELATAVTDETGTGSVVLAASPSLTGTPTVPTASSGDSSSQIANTEFVANAVKNRLSIKTSDYTLNTQDYTVLCNATNATISLTLPSPSESTDKIIIIKKIDTSYNPINFSPSVYLTDSETAISINYPKTIKIQSNGTNWYVIN
jgi:hypothetical protein